MHGLNFVTQDPAAALLWIFPLLMALVFHEWAHGYVAWRCGDDTAAMAGRLTLNPLAHIDPIGTVLLPAMLFMSGAPMFGWARPVPVAFHRLGDPRLDMVKVAAAGPAMNLALAAGSAVLLGVVTSMATPAGAQGGFAVAEPVAIMCVYSIQLNVLLAVLNLVPIPPLDGGRIAVGLLPQAASEALEQVEPFGFLIVVTLLMTGVLSMVLGPVMDMVMGVLRLLM
ncbi:MAG: Zn-dependent protease [Hyphomicrobiaceae bacterium]